MTPFLREYLQSQSESYRAGLASELAGRIEALKFQHESFRAGLDSGFAGWIEAGRSQHESFRAGLIAEAEYRRGVFEAELSRVEAQLKAEHDALVDKLREEALRRFVAAYTALGNDLEKIRRRVSSKFGDTTTKFVKYSNQNEVASVARYRQLKEMYVGGAGKFHEDYFAAVLEVKKVLEG